MIPFGTQNVTLIHRTAVIENGKTKTKYTNFILTGCSWKSSENTRTDTGAVRSVLKTVCRIPASQAKPEVGDVLILGEYLDSCENSADLANILESCSGHAFKIASVADNSLAGVMPHYAARSE